MQATETLNGKTVPLTLFNDYQAVRRQGGKVLFCGVRQLELGACENCNGAGRFALKTVVGGPFESCQQSGDGITSTFIDDKWYLIRTRSNYWCPVCNRR